MKFAIGRECRPSSSERSFVLLFVSIIYMIPWADSTDAGTAGLPGEQITFVFA